MLNKKVNLFKWLRHNFFEFVKNFLICYKKRADDTFLYNLLLIKNCFMS